MAPTRGCRSRESDRVGACTSGTSRVQFAYDAFDRAATRTNNSVTTTYTYQGVSETIAKAVGSATTTYAYGAGAQPIAEKTGAAAPLFHLRDPHGDVVGLVTTSAANQGTRSYDPYGRVLAVSGTQSVLGYQGDLTDPVTAQVDMGTRWYAPGSGRFTARDIVFGQMGDPMSLNQYAYGGMSPVTMIDPTGMGQCTMAGECQDNEGNAVGGNPGASDSPYSDCYSCVFSPPPPPPAPIIEYVPRPFTSPEERAGDIDRYHRWVDHNPSLRVDKVGPGWDAEGTLRVVGDVLRAGFLGGLGGLAHNLFVAGRAMLNLPLTLSYAGLALATGGSCDFEAELTIACYGTPDWPDGTRGGMTIGNTFATHDSRAQFAQTAQQLGTTPARILAHERRHSTQWSVLGLSMAPLYLADWFVAGGDVCKQGFEVTADLADGGYGSCV